MIFLSTNNYESFSDHIYQSLIQKAKSNLNSIEILQNYENKTDQKSICSLNWPSSIGKATSKITDRPSQVLNEIYQSVWLLVIQGLLHTSLSY